MRCKMYRCKYSSWDSREKMWDRKVLQSDVPCVDVASTGYREHVQVMCIVNTSVQREQFKVSAATGRNRISSSARLHNSVRTRTGPVRKGNTPIANVNIYKRVTVHEENNNFTHIISSM